jgi:hypothetical protein
MLAAMRPILVVAGDVDLLVDVALSQGGGGTRNHLDGG